MNFMQLNYFHQVAQTLNVSQSAKELFISQSSLSQSLQHLERELGYPLFDRSGKHLVLNSNGIIFLNAVEKMEHILASAKKELADNNCEFLKEIFLYIECASLILPNLLRYLSTTIPGLKFQILQNHNKINTSNVYLKIFASPIPLDGNHRTLLLEEPILLAIPMDSPLASSPMISANDLREEHFLMLGKNWGLGKFLSQYFEQIDFSPTTVMLLDNPSLMREFLRTGYGLAFVPQITWGTSFSKDTLILRSVNDMSMMRYVYLEWQEDTYMPQTLKTCISAIQEYFSNIHI